MVISIVNISTNLLVEVLYSMTAMPSWLESSLPAFVQLKLLDSLGLSLSWVAVLLMLLVIAIGIAYRYFLAFQAAQKTIIEKEEYIRSNIKLDQFAQIASHDFKSPIRTIKSYAGLTKMKTKTSPEVKAYLDHIELAAEQIEGLTEDLLEFSKVNSMALETSEFKLRDLIKEVVATLSSVIRESEAEIVLSNLPKIVCGDKPKLQTVFHNLLSNSIKFSDKERTPRIEITCRQKGEFFLFFISDNGIGMEPKFLNQIFAQFNKLNTYEEYKGTGLGLSIADLIVTNHGGKMQVSSTPNEGSIFLFSIPRNNLEISHETKKELLNFTFPSLQKAAVSI